MKLKVYMWYDSKTESWGIPMYQPTRGDASRLFTRLVTDQREGNNIALYPSDFTFFECGEYDPHTGDHFLYQAKINLGLAVEYKPKEEFKKFLAFCR